MREVCIVSACRTPIGKFRGALGALAAAELGAVAIREALARAGAGGDSAHEVLMGNVLQAAQGQNPARQAALKAGVSHCVPCTTINTVCGSGMKAVTLGAQAVELGEADCVVAGGMESMSQAPYALARSDFSLGNLTLLDTVLRDGLTDAFSEQHMGAICERIAERHGITREMQDAFAAESQRKCETSCATGRFKDEIVHVPVPARRETALVEHDEHPRPGTTVESLAKLRPAFEPTGTITAGNASGVNDGAAALVIASKKWATDRGIEPMARITSWASAATEPDMFGLAPAEAVKCALEKARLSLDDVGLVEANEAFAAQSIALSRVTGWAEEKVNVNGGAIALGHPIGASGARILVTLLFEMRRRGVRHGLATICVGGGMGLAVVLERLD